MLLMRLYNFKQVDGYKILVLDIYGIYYVLARLIYI